MLFPSSSEAEQLPVKQRVVGSIPTLEAYFIYSLTIPFSATLKYMKNTNATPSPSPLEIAIPNLSRPLTSSVSRIWDLTEEHSDGKGRCVYPLSENVNAHESRESTPPKAIKNQMSQIPNPTDSTHEY